MKKMHPWAIGITAFIVLFLVVTVTVVVFVSQQDFQMVAENYYENDLKYQDEIDAKQRTAALAGKPLVNIDHEAKTCILTFSDRDRYDGITGTVTLFRISDATRDLETPLALNSEGKQFISISTLSSGQWILKLRWSEGGNDYSLDERLYLQD